MTDEFVFNIVEKFNSSDVVDLEFSRGDAHLVLKKAAATAVATVQRSTSGKDSENSPSMVLQGKENESVEKTDAAVKTACTKGEVHREETASSEGELLKSPIVGTFYRSPSPDSPAYAEKGTKIMKGEPLCILEAMKMMNTMNADYDMEIVDILVQNGALVEYDQPLFCIKKI